MALGFLPTLGGEAVPRLLRDFRARHPEVRFALVQASAHRLLARLRDGEIDLCLTAPLPAAHDGVTARGLDEQRIDLFVPVGHRLARLRSGVRLAEAAAEDFIVMEPGYGLRAITDDLCRAAGFEPRITFEGEEADTARGLVGAGLGVSLLPATASSLSDPSVMAGPHHVAEGGPDGRHRLDDAAAADRPGRRVPRLRPYLRRPPPGDGRRRPWVRLGGAGTRRPPADAAGAVRLDDAQAVSRVRAQSSDAMQPPRATRYRSRRRCRA